MDKSAQHKLMSWLSPSYPIGAFSYSHGLEYAIDCGDVSDADSLRDWVSDVIEFGAGRNDAILLSLAYHATDKDVLVEVADLAAALSASNERHLETTAQGSAFAKVTTAVFAVDLTALSLPVALGAAARAEGIALEDVLPLYLHSFAANIITAGVRFVPLGQTDGQLILAGLFDLFDQVATQAIDANQDDLGGICFLSDIAAMKHEDLRTRIFRT